MNRGSCAITVLERLVISHVNSSYRRPIARDSEPLRRIGFQAALAHDTCDTLVVDADALALQTAESSAGSRNRYNARRSSRSSGLTALRQSIGSPEVGRGLEAESEWLWTDYQEVAVGDLSGFEVLELFLDGIAERLHLGQPLIAGYQTSNDAFPWITIAYI